MKRVTNLFLERSYSNSLVGSVLMIVATLLFVLHDVIVKYLSEDEIKFYHFVFYGSPVYLTVPLYLWFVGRLKENLVTSNYFIAIVRGVLFVPMPFIAFTALGNISLPEFTTLVMCSPIFAVLFSLFILKENTNPRAVEKCFPSTRGSCVLRTKRILRCLLSTLTVSRCLPPSNSPPRKQSERDWRTNPTTALGCASSDWTRPKNADPTDGPPKEPRSALRLLCRPQSC